MINKGRAKEKRIEKRKVQQNDINTQKKHNRKTVQQEHDKKICLDNEEHYRVYVN